MSDQIHISVVACSRRPPAWDLHRRNIRRTVGTACEYIRIDNRANSHGICAAYNRGVELSKGDVLVFVHDDVFFMREGWGLILAQKFAADRMVGLIGVAGSQYLFAHNPLWVAAGRPFIRGRVFHEVDDGNRFVLTAFSRETADAEVVAVDGLFFAVRRQIFEHVRFDERTFDRFHFYDLDICMQIRKTHRLMVTSVIPVKHQSAGMFDEEWKRYGTRFLAKYKDDLPASCAAGAPDPSRIIPFESFDVKGKVNQETLV